MKGLKEKFKRGKNEDPMKSMSTFLCKQQKKLTTQYSLVATLLKSVVCSSRVSWRYVPWDPDRMSIVWQLLIIIQCDKTMKHRGLGQLSECHSSWHAYAHMMLLKSKTISHKVARMIIQIRELFILSLLQD